MYVPIKPFKRLFKSFWDDRIGAYVIDTGQGTFIIDILDEKQQVRISNIEDFTQVEYVHKATFIKQTVNNFSNNLRQVVQPMVKNSLPKFMRRGKK